MKISLEERFRYPSKYVAHKMAHCSFRPKDVDTIVYEINNIVIEISRDEYNMSFTGEGRISVHDLEMIINCQKLLRKECQFFSIKSAILNTPKLNTIYLSDHDDLNECIYVGGDSHKPMFLLHKNGLVQRLDFSQGCNVIEMEYVFNLSQYIIISFNSMR